jgi:hypothetical protein
MASEKTYDQCFYKMDNLMRKNSTYESLISFLKDKAKVNDKWIEENEMHLQAFNIKKF